MEFKDLQRRAIEVRSKYDRYNASRGVMWNEQNLMSGFVGDVGDLSKIIMAKHGLRDMEDIDAKLAHELADCLWSILVIADKYNIDIGSQFLTSMDELDTRINKMLKP
jgi:NTP pyrophosphatase (non-canonical NTP hydrolase)